jgi:hypothetical protein
MKELKDAELGEIRMDKKQTYFVHLLYIFLFSIFPINGQQTIRDSIIYVNNTKVLRLIETYVGEPFPLDEFSSNYMETYDHRISDRPIAPVPPTLVDTFVYDIWQRISIDLKIDISYSDVFLLLINDALDVYNQKDWREIAGYRPWTHWNFIRSISSEDRKILAKEILVYILNFGVISVK